MEDFKTLVALGRYRLLQRIGRGGMGEVWLAEDPRLQRQVAIKVLPQRNRDDGQYLLRFEREARAAAALHHPHILPVHDYGQQQQPDGSAITYLVMSYVSGGSLEERLKALAARGGALTQDEALAYLGQVAEAIDYAHTCGIIHRDIKPANMLLRSDNWLFLTDFGIARILEDPDSPTTTGAFLGTPTYMAPEQAQSHAVPASDLYSLAIIAYQLFTGRVPFKADNPLATTFQHAFTAPVAPRMYNPTLPLAFEVALLRGMAKDPAQRPPSAIAFVTSLQQTLAQGRMVNIAAPTPTPTPSAPQTDPSQTLSRPRVARRKLLLGAGTGALLLGGGGAAFAWRVLSHPGQVTLTPTVVVKSTMPATNANAPLVVSNVFTKEVGQMAWSPTKSILTTYSRDGQLVLWDLSAANQSTAPRQSAHHDFGQLQSEDILLSWSPDGQILALGNGGYDLPPATPPPNFSSYETVLYTNELAPVLGVPANSIKAAHAFQGVGWASHNYLVTVDEAFNSTSSRFMIGLNAWNVQQPQQKPFAITIDMALASDFSTTINQVAVSPDGSTVAIGTSKGVLLGQLNTSSSPVTWQQRSQLLSLNDQEISTLAWSKDGHYLAALSFSATVLGIWDATKQYAPVQPIPDASRNIGQVKYLAWSPDAQSPVLAFGGVGGQVALWKMGESVTSLRTLPGNLTNEMSALAWSHDGKWLAASYKDLAASILFWRM